MVTVVVVAVVVVILVVVIVVVVATLVVRAFVVAGAVVVRDTSMLSSTYTSTSHKTRAPSLPLASFWCTETYLDNSHTPCLCT